MACYITQIGKHTFICGLFWQSLSRPRDLKREAMELAKKIDANLMVLRNENSVAQAGYVNSKDGAWRGTVSLASIVSRTLAAQGSHYDGRNQPVHNWLSAFKLPDGMWAYFAVRDANFLPNGDFAGTKEEVLERLHGDYGLGGWNVIIGDPELAEHGFHNFVAKKIEDFLPRKKNGQIKIPAESRLTPVAFGFPWKPVLALSSLAAVLTGGGLFYVQSSKNKQQESERINALEAASKRVLGNEAPPKLPRPWPAKPLPQAMARACMENLTLIAPGGWLLEEYVCSTNQISYLWSRNNSTIDYLLQQVPNALVEVSGNKASYTELLELATGRDETLLEAKHALQPLLSRLQLLGLDPKITNVPMPPQASPGLGQKAPVADWQTFSITLSPDGVPPTTVAEILSQPGVRLDKLSYRQAGWSIEGVIYAK